jgi:Spy/CpxP family protein refolding chaperone
MHVFSLPIIGKDHRNIFKILGIKKIGTRFAFTRIKIKKGGENMKKTLVTLGLVVVMAIGVTYAYGQGPGFGPGPGRSPGPGPSWGERPSRGGGEPGKASTLTPEQETKLNELRTRFRAKNAQLIGAMTTKRIELQSLWSDPKAEAKAILDKEKELRDFQNQMKDQAVQMKLEARQFLTPEQLDQMGPGMGFGPGRGFGRGHGRDFGPGFGPKF